MCTLDPAEQIADALTRLRWRGGRGMPGRAQVSADGGESHHRHEDHHAHHRHHRGAGGPALMRLLATLSAAGEAMSVSDVAEAIGVDQPRASRLVAQAVEFGFAQREADPADARRTRIALTAQGTETVQRMRGARGEAVREALAEFSETEREQLATLLARLVEAWPTAKR